MGTAIILTLIVLIGLAIAAHLINKNNDENLVVLELAPLGNYTMPSLKKTVDLNRYFVDKNGRLYSTNPNTWEINPRFGKDILICSNEALDKSGLVVNSLRAPNSQKVTVRRKDLKFNSLAKANGTVRIVGTKTSPRHIKINAIEA